MKAFQTLAWSERECRRELDEFRALLGSSLALGEREQILPFFRGHPRLAAYLGTYHQDLIFNDALAFLSDSERRRLRWHCEKVMVNSRNILCVTFDELCENLSVRLDRFTRLERKPVIKRRRK